MTSITSAAFRVGDTVEVIASDANRWGDIGNVTEIDPQLDTLRVTFGGSGSDWFDPAELRRLEAAPAESVDPDLTATAQEIKRLQSIIDDQRQQLVRANTRAEAAEAARDDYLERLDTITEKYKSAQILLEGIVAPKRKEVFPFRDITAIELQKRINDGWEILHMQFMANPSGEDRLNVVLSRECPAPHQETPTVRRGDVFIQPAPLTPLNPAPAITAQHRFDQMKAESDARVEAAAPYSPITMAVVNYLEVGS